MTPIHELLARIRWDPVFGAAQFELDDEDHVRRAQVRVPLAHIRLGPDHGFAFEVCEAGGIVHAVPYHRVRNVWRNGELIWHRDTPRV